MMGHSEKEMLDDQKLVFALLNKRILMDIFVDTNNRSIKKLT